MLVTSVDEARRVGSAGRTGRVPFVVRHWSSVLTLAFADFLAFAAADFLFRAWRHEPSFFLRPHILDIDVVRPIGVFSVVTVLFIFMRALAGDYSRREPFWDGVRTTFVALSVAALPDFAAIALRPQLYSFAGIVETWLFLFFAVPAVRQGGRVALSAFGLWQRDTALIGSGPIAETAYAALAASLSLGFDIQWIVSLGDTAEIPASLVKLKAIAASDAKDAGLLVQAAGCDQAILAMSDAQQRAFPELVQRLSEANIGTAIVPPLARLPLGNVTTNLVFGRNILLFQVRDNLRRWPQRVFKRTFDILGAVTGLIVLSPVFAAIAVLVKRQDGGPVTYSQVRIGREGVPFRCIKFRTMSRDADAVLARWREENADLYEEYKKSHKLRDDPRITPFGKWLRRTSLDELPQLVNILRGEMSFVGPRPVVERELVDFYGPAAQLYMRVRPGLTGLWQVSGRSETTYEERIAFDEWYILNWSVWYDLVILAQTLGAMISGHGAY